MLANIQWHLILRKNPAAEPVAVILLRMAAAAELLTAAIVIPPLEVPKVPIKTRDSLLVDPVLPTEHPSEARAEAFSSAQERKNTKAVRVSATFRPDVTRSV